MYVRGYYCVHSIFTALLTSIENSRLIYDFGDETLVYTNELRNRLKLKWIEVKCVFNVNTLDSCIDLHNSCICNLRKESFLPSLDFDVFNAELEQALQIFPFKPQYKQYIL